MSKKELFESWLFQQPLPEEFYEIPSIERDKQVTRTVKSILTHSENYKAHRGDGHSTLVGPICAVVQKLVDIVAGRSQNSLAISSFVGENGTDTTYVATYTRANGCTEVAIYRPYVQGENCPFRLGLIEATGEFKAGKFVDSDHNVFGMALFASLFPTLLETPQVEPIVGQTGNIRNEIADAILSLAADSEKMSEDIADRYAIICDAIYRRTGHPASKGKGIAPEWLINSYIGERIQPLAEAALIDIHPDPVSVRIGGQEYALPCVSFGSSTTTVATTYKFKDVVAEMQSLGAHKREDWPEELQRMIPVVPPQETVPVEAYNIAKTYLLSKTSPCPVNTFMLMGESGTGKSTISNYFVPAILGMPSMIHSCHADTDASDLLVNLQPKSDILGADGEVVTGSKTMADRWQDVTSEEEITCDPVTAWEKLTGTTENEATALDCWRFIATNYLANTNGNKFVSVKSSIVTAAEVGCCCEVQEIDTVRDASIVTALNSLLEEGIITMPNGQRVYRDPNSIFFFTVNQSYTGCNELNQAVYDRIQIKMYLNTPSAKVLIARAKKETGCKDDAAMKKMTEVLFELKKYCNERGIVDGSVGYRSFRNWILAYMHNPMCCGKIYESALITVVATATQNADTYAELVSDVLGKKLKPAGAPTRTKSAATASATY